MTETVVVSVRVPRELRDEAVNLGVDIKKLVVRALEEEVRARKKQKLTNALAKIAQSMNVSEDEWVKLIREMRGARAPGVDQG